MHIGAIQLSPHAIFAGAALLTTLTYVSATVMGDGQRASEET